MATLAEPSRRRDRRSTLLDATCRLIAQTGTGTLRIEDVAREAGVSIGLVYYYFDSRDELLASAFEHANRRAEEVAAGLLREGGTGLERVVDRLLLEVADDPVAAESWMVWIAMTAGAMTQPRLRELVHEAYQVWTAEVCALLEEGREDGSVPQAVDAAASALRLTSSMDGLGTRWMMESIDNAQAQAHALKAIEHELGVAIPPR